jgi:hypothetical protein
MNAIDRIGAAVAGFRSRQQPWLFAGAVGAALAESERALFERIWAEACDARHWTDPDLARAAAQARQALEAGFPGLGHAAASAIAEAAAYQWR